MSTSPLSPSVPCKPVGAVRSVCVPESDTASSCQGKLSKCKWPSKGFRPFGQSGSLKGTFKGYPGCAHTRKASGVFNVDDRAFLKYCVHKTCCLQENLHNRPNANDRGWKCGRLQEIRDKEALSMLHVIPQNSKPENWAQLLEMHL